MVPAVRVADAMRAAGHAHGAVNTENDLAVAHHGLRRADLARKALRPLPADVPDRVRGIRLLTQARRGLVRRARPLRRWSRRRGCWLPAWAVPARG